MGKIEPTAIKIPAKVPARRPFAVNPEGLPTLLSTLFVLAAYVWLVSCGLWTQWPPTTDYYGQLATSFSHGNLALEAKPDPALLALSNPYDPAERSGIPAPTDVSLYNGKFYLYFGPVPALLLMTARLFFPAGIGDQYLVFLFVSGAFILQALLLVRIRARYFPGLSPWLLPAGILVIGLICPAGWVLSLPTVYNAAITGGEFFILAGFYAAYTALDRPSISNWRLTAAGILWIAALGSRITQVLTVGFLALMVMIWIGNRAKKAANFPGSIPAFLALAIPFIIGLAGLGWYNWARFGSAFETGITYQLAGPFLQKYRQDLFSPVYIIQNLYNYLLIPPKLKSAFPFLIPVYGTLKPVIPSLPLPVIYYSQEIAGYLYNAPFILFALVPVIGLFSKSRRQAMENPSAEGTGASFSWLTASLTGAFLVGFAFFLVFFWVAMRYFADFIPPLVLLSVIGFWQLSIYFAGRPAGRFALIVLGILLIAVSVLASNLIALSLNSGRFRLADPILWRQLVNFFRR